MVGEKSPETANGGFTPSYSYWSERAPVTTTVTESRIVTNKIIG